MSRKPTETAVIDTQTLKDSAENDKTPIKETNTGDNIIQLAQDNDFMLGEPNEPNSSATPPAAPTINTSTPETRGVKAGEKRGPYKKKPKAVARADDLAIATASAETVVSILDITRNIIGGNELQPSPEVREGCIKAWAVYLQTKNMQLPPWVEVVLLTSVYVAPAFASERSRGFFSRTWAKLKLWRESKKK